MKHVRKVQVNEEVRENEKTKKIKRPNLREGTLLNTLLAIKD